MRYFLIKIKDQNKLLKNHLSIIDKDDYELISKSNNYDELIEVKLELMFKQKIKNIFILFCKTFSFKKHVELDRSVYLIIDKHFDSRTHFRIAYQNKN